jgi:hypothetical protein
MEILVGTSLGNGTRKFAGIQRNLNNGKGSVNTLEPQTMTNQLNEPSRRENATSSSLVDPVFSLYKSAIRESLTGKLEGMIVDRCERQGMPRTNGWLNMHSETSLKLSSKCLKRRRTRDIDVNIASEPRVWRRGTWTQPPSAGQV